MATYPVLPSSYGSFKISETHSYMVLPKKIKGIVIAYIFDGKLDEGLIAKRFKSISQAKKFLARWMKKFRKMGIMPIACIYTEHGYMYSRCKVLNIEKNAYIKRIKEKLGDKYRNMVESDKTGISYWVERIN